jgi:hypothetical protein
MKKIGIYFSVRIFAVISLVLLLAVVYEKFLHPETLRSEGWLKEIGEKRFLKRADILYFSASPNASFSVDENDKRSIHQMIRSLYKKQSIEALDAGAIHAGIFLHALTKLPKDYAPKTILMDLNVRSLGIRWLHSGLENSLQRNLLYWNSNPGLYNRINAALKNYKQLSAKERNELIGYGDKFYQLPFPDSCQTIKKWVDSLNRRIDHSDKVGQELVRYFGFEVKDGNEMLGYYDQIVSFCAVRKIELIFLILPENLEGMTTHAGANLSQLCLENVVFLKKHFKGVPVQLIDAVSLLGSPYFYESYPTEHYLAEGRMSVAKLVVDVLNKGLKR